MVHKEEKRTWHISFYSSYWMVNKTEMTLHYTVRCLQLQYNFVLALKLFSHTGKRFQA